MKAWDVLTSPGARVHVRTARHPTLEGLPPHVALTTFDHVYESTKMLQDVYPAIAEELLTIAETVARTSVADVPGASREAGDAFSSFVLEDGDDEVVVRKDERQRRIVYAVPGDPCVAENSVKLLRQMASARGVKVTIVPGVSFLEPTLASLKTDVMPSLCVVDAIDVATAGHAVGMSVDAPTLLCQLYSKAVASDVKLTLMQQFPSDHPVTLVHAAGTKDEKTETVPLHSLDADVGEDIDILTSAFVPAVAGGKYGDEKGSVESLLDAIARARRGDVAGETEPGKKSGPDADDDDDDDESTSDGYDETYFGGFGDDAFESVWLSLDHADGEAHAFLRDAGEAAAAAAAADASADVRKKTLGDLLAAVALHVAMASEAGEFTMRDVVVEAARDVRKRT
jgi:tetrapyrrole methylase family protein/MazG family protein